ncbi:MAG: zinc-binding dehydrogenase [Chloroflexi bacterium]|nr:zinc-binding dehydrogenase [Chloroflexota bacterium]
MKAVYMTQHGAPDVLTYGERPEPVTGPGEIKVRVKACSLNRLDIWIRSGQRGTRRDSSKPHILGADVAGDVVEVGDGVHNVKVGDRVLLNPRLTCGRCQYCLKGQDDYCPSGTMLGEGIDGGYAELVKAPAVNAHVLPSHVGYEEAAAMPTTFMPVWNIFMRKARLQPWETCLVLSASSGVGTAAIQVAKKVIGARVIVTTSTPEKAAKARALGADEVILYTQEDVVQRVKELTEGQGADLVLDHLGAEFFPTAFNSLKVGGRFATCGVTTGWKAELHMGQLFTRHLTLMGVRMGCKEDLRQIVELLCRGVIKGYIHQSFPLSEAREAHETMEGRNFFGKLILKP